jgi:hypothetical protein
MCCPHTSTVATVLMRHLNVRQARGPVWVHIRNDTKRAVGLQDDGVNAFDSRQALGSHCGANLLFGHTRPTQFGVEVLATEQEQ